ncbi:MAG TPA: family 10 glycosylhydrolase, partial [Phycisphaerae bacterium]
GSNPGWDPLAYAIDAAHANGIEFHAYINTHTCWQSSAHVPPTNPNHLFFAHTDASNPNARDWLIHDAAGNPVQWSEDNYVWLAPGVPAYQAYIRQQILYVVQNYDVDGVHFDRIRTPNSSYSYDPISQARRLNPQSNPNNLDFSHWTRDQITRNVRDAYADIMVIKPWVKVSAAVFPDSTTAPANQHQEALVWAQTGGMDMLVPMLYSSGGQGSTWDMRLQAWLAGTDRHVVAGQNTSVGVTTLIDQINLSRLRGAEGNSVFSWSSFTFWSNYDAAVYQQAAMLPPMSWKDNPTTGILCGYVTAGGAQPVADAQVVRSGSSYVGLSTGDGFYSFLLVPPGTYTLTASHPAYGSLVVPNVSVAAGQVVQQNISLGALLPPIISEVTPDPDSVVEGMAYSRQLTLTQGSADSWALIAGPPGASVSSMGYVSGWTPDAVDVGQSHTFTVRATNAVGFDDESWQVNVTGAPLCSVLTITDFDAYTNGTRVLFNNPRFSGSTVNHLTTTPDVAQVSSAVPAFDGGNSYQVQWQFVDTTAQRWLRLTSFNVANVPNPTIALDQPIRVRLRLDSGQLRLTLGVRETGTTAAPGQNGGTTGTIEWVGAASTISGAPQGVLVQPMPGAWQTFIFDPLTDPILGFTGDGVLISPTGLGTLEHLAFSVAGNAGPFMIYIDDVDQLCSLPEFGDLVRDGQVDLADYAAFRQCLNGPLMTVGSTCLLADADGDADVDLRDCAAFQSAFTGAL